MTILDASATRPLEGGASFSLRNRLLRLSWITVWLVGASWTPRSFHAWRRFLLRLFGAKMGHRADVRATARIWHPANLEMGDRSMIGPRANCYNQAPVRIGKNTIISQGVHLCAGSHDVDDPNFQLVTKPITIGDGVWIAAEAFVGAGAVIPDFVVLGARAVTFGRLESNWLYVGNPAKAIRERRLPFASMEGSPER